MARSKNHPVKIQKDEDKKTSSKKTIKEEDKGKESRALGKTITKHRVSRVIKEVKEQQNSTGFAIRKLPFSRLSREIGQDYSTDIRWSAEAFLALQTAAENHLVKIFSDANFIRLAANAKRQSIRPDDVLAALRVDSSNMNIYFLDIVKKSAEVYHRDKNTKDPLRRKLMARAEYWTAQVNKKKQDIALLDKYNVISEVKSKKEDPHPRIENDEPKGTKRKLKEEEKREEEEEEEEKKEERDVTEDEEEKPKKIKKSKKKGVI